MSFLSSVLNSINGGKGPITAPPVNAPKKEAASTGGQSTAASAKRKASGEFARPIGKLQRSESKSANTNVITTPRPSLAGSSSSSNVSALKTKNSDAARLAPETAKAPPKKGSFAEILARGKQNSSLPVGKITHKPKEKEGLSAKKELLLQREQARQRKKGKAISNDKSAAPGAKRTSTQEKSIHDLKNPRKGVVATHREKAAVKHRPQPTYQGTAKPKAPQPAYQGTMKPNKDSSTKRGYDSEPDRIRAKATQQRRGGYSDHDSEEEDDDGYDYASEDYSDMDAGFDDLDEEEAEAEREAKKEDLREQKMLEELARQKEERKKRARISVEKGKAPRR